jgi:predicted nucleic acid-binding protein
MLMEAALAGEAPCVVTGDEDLLNLGTYETVSFVIPRSLPERLDEGVSGVDEDDALGGAS